MGIQPHKHDPPVEVGTYGQQGYHLGQSIPEHISVSNLPLESPHWLANSHRKGSSRPPWVSYVHVYPSAHRSSDRLTPPSPIYPSSSPSKVGIPQEVASQRPRKRRPTRFLPRCTSSTLATNPMEAVRAGRTVGLSLDDLELVDGCERNIQWSID